MIDRYPETTRTMLAEAKQPVLKDDKYLLGNVEIFGIKLDDVEYEVCYGRVDAIMGFKLVDKADGYNLWFNAADIGIVLVEGARADAERRAREAER